jgi:hypothetical protein
MSNRKKATRTGRVARSGAAAFALGVFLAGPQAAVAAADDAGASSSAAAEKPDSSSTPREQRPTRRGPVARSAETTPRASTPVPQSAPVPPSAEIIEVTPSLETPPELVPTETSNQLAPASESSSSSSANDQGPTAAVDTPPAEDQQSPSRTPAPADAPRAAENTPAPIAAPPPEPQPGIKHSISTSAGTPATKALIASDDDANDADDAAPADNQSPEPDPVISPALIADTPAIQATTGPAAAAPAAAPAPTTASATPAPTLAELNTAVVDFFDNATTWLASLPANPLSDFLSGALLLVRRTLFNQLPTADPAQADIVTDTAQGFIYATDPEGDQLTYTVIEAPGSGTVEIDAEGYYVYTPNEGVDLNFFADEFTVAVSDNAFNLLDPLSSRQTLVQVLLNTDSRLGASQGFEIVNLTNQVIWLSNYQWRSSKGNTSAFGTTVQNIETCRDQGFCLTGKVKGKVDQRYKAMLPGDVLRAEISTPYAPFGSGWKNEVNLEFTGADTRQWYVGITAVYSDSDSKITNGSAYGRPYAGEPTAYDPNNSRRLLLTNEAGTVHTITAETAYNITPPDRSQYPNPMVDSRGSLERMDIYGNELPENLSAIAVLQRYQKLSEKLPTAFVPTYSPGVFRSLSDRATETNVSGVTQPVQLTNSSDQSGNRTVYNFTATGTPGPAPSSPWWQTYAAQGAEELSKFLLGKIPFVPQGIAGAVSKAIGQQFQPEKAKEAKTWTGSQELASLPHSVSVLLVGTPKFDVTGDIVYDAKGTGTKFEFKQIDYQIVDTSREATYRAQFVTQPYQDWQIRPIGGQPGQKIKAGFTLQACADNACGSVVDVAPTYKVGSSGLLKVEAFKGAGNDGSRPADFSTRGCVDGATTNCATFTVSDTSIAEVVIEAGRAKLIAKKPGKVTVTATFNWEIPTGGVDPSGAPLPPLRDFVEAEMSATITK